mgnify:CR=1 FL=1
MKNGPFVRDSIVIGVFENKNAIRLRPFVVRTALVSVVLLNEHPSIRCHRNANWCDDLRSFGKHRHSHDIGMWKLELRRALSRKDRERRQSDSQNAAKRQSDGWNDH